MTKLSRIEQLQAEVAAAADVAPRVRAMNALAYELSRTGQAQRAIALAEEAQALGQQVSDAGLAANCFHTLARCRFYLADFLGALEGLLQAAQIYHATGDVASEAIALAGVGLCQDKLGAREEAGASLLRALESARAQGLATLETNIQNSLAALAESAGRLDDAARHAAAGMALARAQGDRNLLTKLLGNDALVAQQRGDLAAAAGDAPAAAREYAAGLAQVRQALSLARELGNRYDEAHCLGNSGALLRRRGRHADAAAALDGTLSLGRELADLPIQVEAQLELGRLHAESDRPLARRCFEEAIRLADGITAKNLLADACKTYSACLEQWGDPAAALTLYKRYDAVREAELARTRTQAVRAVIMLDYERVTREVVSLAADRKILATQTRELAAASQQDPLTGLLNRRGFDEKIGALAAASATDGTLLTLALIDLDNFNAINDTFSHPVGDAVLGRVARIIRAHCRAQDLAVRYGGDEFLVVLGGADLEGAELALRRFKDAVDACAWEDVAGGLAVTVSIGVATAAPPADIPAAIAEADRALYAAKNGGRDRILRARDVAVARSGPAARH